jgi:hypothetical protein
MGDWHDALKENGYEGHELEKEDSNFDYVCWWYKKKPLSVFKGIVSKPLMDIKLMMTVSGWRICLNCTKNRKETCL